MDKKKITIAVVAVAIVIAIAIIVFLLTKNTNTVYTISFNTDGGNEVVSQEIEEGKKINKPAEPTKDGYEFLGWYLNGEYFDFEAEVESNITLDAKWKEIVKEEQPDINEEENKDDEVVEDNKDDEKEDEEETTKVTKYTVTFDSNGGSKVSKQTVEKNKKAKEPADPTKEGYIFKGWYLGSTKYNFSNKVTKNITLTAKWEKVKEEQPSEPSEPTEPEKPEVKEYTVSFNTDGGSEVKAQTVKENETASKPSNPTKDGYTFKGWYLDGAEYNFSNKVTKNITLIAKWEKVKEEQPSEPSEPTEPEKPEVKEYTVTFNTDGGSAVKSQTIKENMTASKPSNPTKQSSNPKKGYIFKGWYLDGAQYDFSKKVTKDVTLTAKWSEVEASDEPIKGSIINQVKILVTLDGVPVAGTVDITYVNGTKATISVPASGYIEVGGTYSSISNPKVK